MDFFEAQERARKKTGLLVFYFASAVILMWVGIYLVTVGVFYQGEKRFHVDQAPPAPIDWFQPQLLMVVSFILLVIVGGGCLFKIAELRAGGSRIARKLGGKLVHRNTNDPLERRLINVVEEMAIASGIAVPPVYVLHGENGINAFAAGFTPDDAVIGVSRGTLEYLNRDELQGVIAHEFSHVLNGDMRFNLRLIGLLHGILLVAIVGYYVLRFGGYGRYSSGRDSNKGGGQIALVGLACLILGYVGLFFGRLIKAAVSRQREYLADASAVQFTRNPLGITGALKKIGGVHHRSDVKSPEAETTSHMFFGSALRRSAFSPFATHPPLVQRIQAIDPQFDGTFPEVKPVTRPTDERQKTDPEQKTADFGFGGLLGALDRAGTLPLDPVVLVMAVGAPTSDHVDFSRTLLEALPPVLTEAVHEPFSSRAVVFALLLSHDGKVRHAQLGDVERGEGLPTRQETEKLAEHLKDLDRALRLPVIEMVQASLRELSPAQYDRFRTTVEKLVAADRRITVFEFVLQRLLLSHLDRIFHRPVPPTVLHHKVTSVSAETAVLLSSLVHLGHKDQQDAAEAFLMARATLGLGPDEVISLLDKRECSVREVDLALTQLARVANPVKKRILCAATLCIAADGRVTVAEAELLRVIADSLGCPIPPIVAGKVKNPEAGGAKQ